MLKIIALAAIIGGLGLSLTPALTIAAPAHGAAAAHEAAPAHESGGPSHQTFSDIHPSAPSHIYLPPANARSTPLYNHPIQPIPTYLRPSYLPGNLANDALKRQHHTSPDNHRLFLRRHRPFFGPFFNRSNDYNTRYVACDWLRQQTSSADWWQRYQDCLAQNG
jgi:hypothetical protein